MVTKAPTQSKPTPENSRATDMTLLDYVAIQVLHAFYTSGRISVNTPRDQIAKEAYDQAEAMLEERKSR